MAGSEEQGNKFEDLFEDLDKFFGPIEQVDRPLRDIEHHDGPSDEDKEKKEEPQAAPAPSETAGAPPREPVAPAIDEPTSEMTGADWGRLRDALGEQEDQDEE